MKKYITLLVLGSILSLTHTLAGQETIVSTKSIVSFDAGKNIEAENITSKFIIRESDNSIVSLIVIKDFIFPNSLMQEHFNENYIESDKYPEASFSGKLKGFNKEILSNVETSFVAEGKLTIHGVTQKVKLPISLAINGDNLIELKSAFNVRLEDYKIKVPKIMFVKIAEEAEVSIKAIF